MNKTCRLCSSAFNVAEEDLAFYQKVSPVFNNQQFLLPPPSLCPDCRQQRRMSFRNERQLYPDECAKCQRKIISLYSPDKKHIVYCQDCFLGDSWDARDYALDYDPTRPFLEQFKELQLRVPRIAMFSYLNENSEYTNHSSKNKNCYIGTGFGDCEDCMYGHWVLHSKNVVDCLYVDSSEQSYQCSYCLRAWQSAHCAYCSGIRDCLLCFECRDCSNCIACVQLQRKQYHILNQEVSPEEFHKLRAELLSSRSRFAEFQKKYQKLVLSAPRRYSYQLNCEDSVGDDLWNCRNAQHCFNCRELEDCKYMYDLGNNRTSMDCYEHGYLVQSELNYEAHAGMAGYHLLFCNLCSEARDLIYCDLCGNRSHDLFGCVGIRRNSHCILNKQYSAAEYDSTVARIIANFGPGWGEFFPAHLSPFGYNETSAPECYPLDKTTAVALGFNWSDYESPAPQVAKILKAAEVPENIALVSDEILKFAIECEISKRLFRITKAELAFYRQHNLPLPLRHPDERHRERMQMRNSRFLERRSCENCGEELESTFSARRKERVYCASCYEKAVYA